MGLFGNGFVYLVISGKSITLFTGKGKDEFIFPTDTVAHQEIINEVELEKGLDTFFKKYKKHTAVIILSDGVLYYKSFPLATALPIIKQGSEKFFQKAPFNSHFVAKKIVPLKDSALFIATNLQMFGLIHEIAEKHGWKIPYILPINVFYTPQTEINYNSLKKILTHKTHVENSDFLRVNKYEQSLNNVSAAVDMLRNDSETAEQVEILNEIPKKNNYLLLFLIVLLITIIIASLVGYFLFLNNKNIEGKKVDQTSVVKLSPTIKPTFPVQEVVKEENIAVSELTVRVLNGSGVAGQASEVKILLEEKGFSDVKTGNANEVIEATDVEFGPRVNANAQELVNGVLNDSFNNVESKQTSSAGAFDILITTGTDIIEL